MMKTLDKLYISSAGIVITICAIFGIAAFINDFFAAAIIFAGSVIIALCGIGFLYLLTMDERR